MVGMSKTSGEEIQLYKLDFSKLFAKASINKTDLQLICLSPLCSSVAKSLYLADFPPSARGDQFTSAASGWTGSVCGGIQYNAVSSKRVEGSSEQTN